MLNRFEKRQVEANRFARNMLADYGYDYESAKDRILECCDGQRWFARMVDREMQRLTGNLRQRRRAA